MKVTRLKVEGRDTTVSAYVTVPMGNMNVDAVQFETDEEWDGLVRKVLFTDRRSGDTWEVLPDENGAALVPYEITKTGGRAIEVTLVGLDTENNRRLVSMPAQIIVQKSRYVEDPDLPGDLTPTLAEQLIDMVTRAVEEAEDVKAAYDAGELNGTNGVDGVSPDVTVTNITGGHRIRIQDKNGVDQFDVIDGISPEVAVEDVVGGHKFTITDASGSHSAVILDGERGVDGLNGRDGIDGTNVTVSVSSVSRGVLLTINDVNGKHQAYLYNGSAGAKGEDGVSPTIGVESIDDGHRVTVRDVKGVKTFDVMNGERGERGAMGPTGPVGPKGNDGTSVTASISSVSRGILLTITDLNGKHQAYIYNGATGATGAAGADGVSPSVAVTQISGGHRVAISDAGGESTFDVMDGAAGPAGASYDDTELRTAIALHSAELETQAGDIDALEESLDGKQDAIADLDTIRSGAALGATALQSVDSAKTQLTDASYPAWTAAEQAAARARIGVGGGGLELIETVTFDGTVNKVFRKLTPDGKAFNFDEFVLVLDGNGSTVASCSQTRINGDSVWGGDEAAYTSSSMNAVYSIIQYSTHTGIAVAYSRSGLYNYAAGHTTFNHLVAESVTSISYIANGCTPVDGATLNIYARWRG